MRAVVFDLWLTLIPFPPEVRAGAFRRTSEALGFDPDELQPHWKATRAERETTELSGYLHRLGRQLSAPWTETPIDAAIAARSSSHAVCFADAFADGREAIQALRERNITIGLVSNCTSDVRAALVEHEMDQWFDQMILSAEVGVMKPATEIYALAANRLDVDPASCLYVGDGSDSELAGAAKAGMRPVLYNPKGSATEPELAAVTSHLDLLAYIDR